MSKKLLRKRPVAHAMSMFPGSREPHTRREERSDVEQMRFSCESKSIRCCLVPSVCQLFDPTARTRISPFPPAAFVWGDYREVKELCCG